MGNKASAEATQAAIAEVEIKKDLQETEDTFFKKELQTKEHNEVKPLCQFGEDRAFYYTSDANDPSAQHGYVLRPSLYHLYQKAIEKTAQVTGSKAEKEHAEEEYIKKYMKSHCTLLYLQPSAMERASKNRFFYVKKTGDPHRAEAKRKERLERDGLAQQAEVDAENEEAEEEIDEADGPIEMVPCPVCEGENPEITDWLVSSCKHIACADCWRLQLEKKSECITCGGAVTGMNMLAQVHICFVCDSLLTSSNPPYCPPCEHLLCMSCWENALKQGDSTCYECNEPVLKEALQPVAVDYL